MGVRTNVDMSVNVGFGASLDDLIFQRDVSELLDTLDHATAQVITMAGAEADYEVDFGDVTVPKLLYVEADREVTVKLWGTGGETLLVERPAAPTTTDDVKAYLLVTATFVSLHLTNPDATNSIRVRVLIAGDLVT